MILGRVVNVREVILMRVFNRGDPQERWQRRRSSQEWALDVILKRVGSGEEIEHRGDSLESGQWRRNGEQGGGCDGGLVHDLGKSAETKLL